MSSNNAVVFLVLLAILALGAYSNYQRDKRRADYNRQIGQPDLRAPMPSEVHARQRAADRDRLGCGTLIAILLIIIVVILAMIFVLPFFAALFAAI